MTIFHNPLVTVYIPNHNYSNYIEESIQSVLRQTFSDFELIIIDDGSVDNSKDIIKKYEDLPNVNVIFQKNKGLNVTNNIALRMGNGKYIMRLDADDYLDENSLNILSDVLERNSDIGMVLPDYYRVDENGNIIDIVNPIN